jgi:hypothetical protein
VLLKKKPLLNLKKRKALILRLQRRKLLEADYPLLENLLKEEMRSQDPPGRQPKDDEATDKQDQTDSQGDNGDSNDADKKEDKQDQDDKKKKKNHGHLGSADYPGAKNKDVPHESLNVGGVCPHCAKGRLYGLKPKELINLFGGSPIEAIRYLLEYLRCGSCQQTFTAPLPADASADKCQPSANATVALMKYGLGVPSKRLETWQGYFGIPLPDSSQFDMCEELTNCLLPVFRLFEILAADSWIFHLDDTQMAVLSLIKENKSLTKGERYGMNATAILAYYQQHPIYLYYVGRKHAGENLGSLLEKRTDGLLTPIQMGDASSNNTKHDHETTPIYCSSHGFRKFKDTAEAFDWESGYILSLLGGVFKNDAVTKGMSQEERLAYHQQHSASLMDQAFIFMTLLMKKDHVEPRSTLGKAITYMLKRWTGFTCFLRVPGAPLDNNIIERALKLMIRFRKNALFFKNEVGAWIGSLLTSILATATASGANPMDYLVAVQIHRKDVADNPELWLPWNYRDRMNDLSLV